MNVFLLTICILFQLMCHDSFSVRQHAQSQLTYIALRTDIRTLIISNMQNVNPEIRVRSRQIWNSYCDIRPSKVDFFPCIDNVWSKPTDDMHQLYIESYRLFVANENGISTILGTMPENWKHKNCRARLATQYYIMLMAYNGVSRKEIIGMLDAGVEWEQRNGITPAEKSNH